MKPEDVQWNKSPVHGRYDELWTARFDTLSEDGAHRLGKTVNAAHWPTRGTYSYAVRGFGVVDADALAFKCWLLDKCQVFYNNYGEF